MADVEIRSSVISASNTFAIVMYVFASGWLVCLGAMGCFLAANRTTKAVSRKSPVFMGLILAGSALMTVGIFLQYAYPSFGVCSTQVWCVAIGFALVYGSATAKNWRIWRIFSNDTLETFGITNARLFAMTLAPALTIMIFLLALWTGISPFTLTLTKLDKASSLIYVDAICASASSVLPAITFTYAMLLLASTAVISILIQRIASTSRRVGDYNESLALGNACLGVAIFQILAASIAVGFITDVDDRAATLALVILFPTVTLPLAVVGPLLWAAIMGTLDADSLSGSGGATVAVASVSMDYSLSAVTSGGTYRNNGNKQRNSGGHRRPSATTTRGISSSDSDAYNVDRITTTIAGKRSGDVGYFYAALQNDALVERAISRTIREVSLSSRRNRQWLMQQRDRVVARCCGTTTGDNATTETTGSSSSSTTMTAATPQNTNMPTHTMTGMNVLREIALDAVARIRAAGPGSTATLLSLNGDPTVFQQYQWFRVPFIRRLRRYMRCFRAVAFYEITFGRMMGGDVADVIQKERAMLAACKPRTPHVTTTTPPNETPHSNTFIQVHRHNQRPPHRHRSRHASATSTMAAKGSSSEMPE